MTKKERFLTAVRRGVPDQVPVSPLIHCRYAHKVLGRSDWHAVFEVHQRLGSTAFRGPQGIGFEVEWPAGFREEWRELDRRDGRVTTEHVIITPKGRLKATDVSGMIPDDPLVSKTTEYYVKTPQDWLIYQSYLEAWLESAKPDLPGMTRIWETMGDEGIASAGMGGAYHALAGVRGMEGMLTDLYDCPDILAAVMETQREVVRRQVAAFLESPCEVLYYDICWATGSRMGPKHFERWVVPELGQACEQAHTVPNKYIGFYTLGRIRELLPMMVDAGPDYIETFEQNEGDLTLAQAKRRYGDRICLMGNFDPVILARGTRQQAFEEARRCLREGMEGGGYVMVTGDEVPADTKWENLQAMVEAVEKHGAYG
jgi:hypothetical protein